MRTFTAMVCLFTLLPAVGRAGGASSVQEGQLLVSFCPKGTTDSDWSGYCDEQDDGILGTGLASETQRVSPEIFVLDGEGNGKKSITRNDIREFGHIVWSPDRTMFTVSGGSDEESCRAYVVHTRTLATHAVTPDQELSCGIPTDWSRDGRWILMSANFHDGPTQLYKVRPNGDDLTALTDYDFEGQGAWDARWIRGGTRIVFRADPDIGSPYRSGIYVMNARGKDVHALDQVSGRGPDPRHIDALSVASGRKQLVYSVRSISADGRDDSVVALMDIESGNRRTLAKVRSEVTQLEWSSRSRFIAAVTFQRGDERVRIGQSVIDLDSGHVMRVPPLAHITVMDFDPLWSPSGRYLAFVGARKGTRAAFVFDTVDKTVGQVTRFTRTFDLLAWR